MIRWLGLVVLNAPLLLAEEAKPSFIREKSAAKLESPAIAEASGLAASPTAENALWVINDSGNTPELHLIGTDGTDRGKVTVRDAPNRDWEDLASFSLNGRSYLIIADSGDNNTKRAECVLYIVAEPALTEGVKLEGAVAPAWTIRFRYEDGPRDCESVAVDAAAGKILLLSKRTTPPVLYEMPLKPVGKETVVAKKAGEVAHPFPAGFPPMPFATQPTGFDISPDGSKAVVVTYSGTFLFARDPGETWKATFAKPPAALEPHRLRQAEAVAFSRDGSSIHVVSEGAGSPVVTYRREKQKP